MSGELLDHSQISARGDADSIEMDDDFYIVDDNNISVSFSTSVVDSLTSSEFSLGSDTKDVEEDKTSNQSQDNKNMDLHGGKSDIVAKGKTSKHGKKSGPHVNPAFEDDDGFVVVVDDDDDNEKTDDPKRKVSEDRKTQQDKNVREIKKVTETVKEKVKSKITDTQGTIEMVELQRTVEITETKEGLNVNPAKRHAPQIGHLRASDNLRKERESDGEDDICNKTRSSATVDHKPARMSPNTDRGSSQNTNAASEHSPHELSSTAASTVSSSPKHVLVEHIVPVQPSNRARRTGDDTKLSRPQSRSISSMPKLEVLDDSTTRKSSLPIIQPVSRSQSLRVPAPTDSSDGPTKGKSRKLLRELSFSDADAKTVRNYGALRGGNALPRRKPPRQTDKENGAEYSEGNLIKVTPELKSHMLSLMQELLDRGKIHQIAVLEQDGGTMLESLPQWTLTHSDELGLVKAVTCTQQNMVKLPVGKEMYTFFKHGQNKIMGRSGDNVLVAEKTNACVVVGVAVDDTPGSCLYEVSELVQALMDKGW